MMSGLPTIEPEGSPVSNGDIRRLVDCYPLAWVSAANGAEASQLPLVGVFDSEDRLVEIIGHLSLQNPLHGALKRSSRALILFSGPQGYISPSMVGRRNWGPTWNFAQLKVEAEIDIRTEFTADALESLAEHVEAGQPEPWKPTELGDRFDALAARIIGFRAVPTRLVPRFKLGQEESLQDLDQILSAMPDNDLKSWMKQANRDRLSDAT